jgi:hypothetical protein
MKKTSLVQYRLLGHPWQFDPVVRKNGMIPLYFLAVPLGAPYSALACCSKALSGSASFHKARKPSLCLRASSTFPLVFAAGPSGTQILQRFAFQMLHEDQQAYRRSYRKRSVKIGFSLVLMS